MMHVAVDLMELLARLRKRSMCTARVQGLQRRRLRLAR